MLHFMWGALAMSSLTASVFFLRFYRDTRDRLFIMFAAAFAVLAVHWGAFGIVRLEDEDRPFVYLARLLAFGFILLGIVDKNRRLR